MRLLSITIGIYLFSLAISWTLPIIGMLDRNALDGMDIALYGGAIAIQAFATLVATLFLCRFLFPEYWWRGQVVGQDIFELEGIYFTGLRLDRVPGRIQRILFGIGERQRRWDAMFGLMYLALLVMHILSVFTVSRQFEDWFPTRTKFPETMHYAILSSMPIMQGQAGVWRPGARANAWAGEQYNALRRKPNKSNEENYRLAQLMFVQAFQERANESQPFRYSPADRIVFNRGKGAQAIKHLNTILRQPDAKQENWAGAALAMIGFFHLSDQNFPRAAEFFKQALSRIESGKNSAISPYLVQLMNAHAVMMMAEARRAEEILEKIILTDRIPGREYALAMEHFAEALRLQGKTERVQDILSKSLELYNMQENRAGIARVYLRMAVLAIEQRRLGDASRELSLASSHAAGLQDWFTINMVGLLSLHFPTTG